MIPLISHGYIYLSIDMMYLNYIMTSVLWFMINFCSVSRHFNLINVAEYNDSLFLKMLKEHGSYPRHSQQNRHSERKLGHILNMVCELLSTSLPKSFWGEAALTIVYKINQIPFTALNYCIPYEILYHVSPNYTTIHTFGCVHFILLHPHEHNKLQPRSRLYCFLGYGIEQKGYQCYDPIDHRLRISHHVFFGNINLFLVYRLCPPSSSNLLPCLQIHPWISS